MPDLLALQASLHEPSEEPSVDDPGSLDSLQKTADALDGPAVDHVGIHVEEGDLVSLVEVDRGRLLWRHSQSRKEKPVVSKQPGNVSDLS